MQNNIGIFMCGCGTNIKDMVNMDEITAYAKSRPGVGLILVNDFYCNIDGKNLIKETIRKEKLTHVIVVGCSPKTHLATFEKCCEEGGLNAYYLQMVNAREQVTWVTEGKQNSTEKIKSLINGAVNRVVVQEALEKKQIDCNTDVVIIGGGIAGIEAAILIGQAGDRNVYIIEKEPSLGGNIVKYDEVFPNMECAPCMVAPRLSELSSLEKVKVITSAEVQDIVGYFGNYSIKVKQNAKYVDEQKCIGCQACFEVCPATYSSKFDENMRDKKAIDILFPGSVPNCAFIVKEKCLRFNGQDCTLCKDSCPFDALKYDDTDKETVVNAGAIIVATGSELYDIAKAAQYGYKRIDNVYTTLEFERIIAQTGPTDGQLVLKSGDTPKSVAVIHCAGSKNKDHLPYCSGICCLNALKASKIIKHRIPDVKVTELYVDLTLPGKQHHDFYEGIKHEGVDFVQLKNSAAVSIDQENANIPIDPNNPAGIKIKVTYTDIHGKTDTISVDMVVLSPGLVPAQSTRNIQEMLKLPIDKNGFLSEDNMKLNEVSSTIEGIFIAGTAQYPKDISATVSQALASCGKVFSKLVPGKKLDVEVMVSQIDQDLCAGCKVCIALCPYKAINFNEDTKKSELIDVLCQGCGTCVAACPSGAAKSLHFTDKQIFEEIKGVLA